MGGKHLLVSPDSSEPRGPVSDKQIPTADLFELGPNDFLPSPNFKAPEITPIPLIPKLEEIIRQNESLNKSLDTANARIESLERRAAQAEKSHKHDTIKSIAVNVGVAVISILLTILATRCGWL